MDEKRPSLPALTGLRFLAALWVVLGHYCGWHPGLLPARFGAGVPLLLARNPDVPVSLFFVLSGFILVYAYAGLARSDSAALWRYYLNRLARLGPIYLVALLIAAPPLLWQAGSRALLHVAPAALSLTQSWWLVPGTLALVWDPPAWSLSTEVGFYLLFPFLLPPLLHLNRRALCLIGLICVAATILLPLLIVAYSTIHLTPYSSAYWSARNVLLYNPLSRLPEFALGMVSGRLFLLLPHSMARVLPWGPWYAVWATLLVIGVAWGETLPDSIGEHGVLAPLFALLIVGLAAGGGRLGLLLGSRAMVLLGEASYALYLLHYPIRDWLVHFGLLEASGWQGWAEGAAYLTLTVAAAMAAHLTVERPARAAIRGLARGRQRPARTFDASSPVQDRQRPQQETQ